MGKTVGQPLRVLIVDDHAMVRSGFTMMLSVESDIEVVGEAANGEQAISQASALRPDVVLMDVQMPVMDGIEATRQIAAADLSKVLILTTFDSDDYLFEGLAAGASGFMLKNAQPDQLVEAVRAVGHGHALLAPEVTRRVIAQTVAARGAGGASGAGGGMTSTARAEKTAAMTRLTDREREILEHLGRGRSNAEIAAELFLGEATVKTHVSNCLAKLHLRDRVQAVVFAYEAGLILPSED